MPGQLLDQKSLVEEYLGKTPRPLSAFSFTSIFAWQDFFTFDFKVLHDCLCVFAGNQTGSFLYLPPLGKEISSAAIDGCFAIMEDVNQGSGVTRIENVSAGQLSLFPTERFAHYKKAHEYIYDRDDIASLQGKAYRSKRSSYNQVAGNYSCDYGPYEEGMLDECLSFYGRWAAARKEKQPEDDIYGTMLDENRTVHETVLRYDKPLGLTGRVVKIGGEIRAYTFGFPVNSKMFCALFEVADLDVKGLATYIFREFCRDAAVAQYKFINGMDDFGLDNVRQTKMSFGPCAVLPLYVITKKV